MRYRDTEIKIESFKGLVFTSIEGGKGDGELIFHTDDGREYQMFHQQDCCEDVRIEDIVGDLTDLLNTPILLAGEESYENTNPAGVPEPEYQDCFTWTFYKLATIKGYVDIRWYGESNGYYSEEVSIYRVNKAD